MELSFFLQSVLLALISTLFVWKQFGRSQCIAAEKAQQVRAPVLRLPVVAMWRSTGGSAGERLWGQLASGQVVVLAEQWQLAEAKKQFAAAGLPWPVSQR